MITVLLAEGLQMVRGALAALLNQEPGIEVVAEAATGDEVLPTALRTRPKVAVISIDLPRKDALTAAREVQQQVPGCRTLILACPDRPERLRPVLTARVNGLILKDVPADELANAVRGVAADRRVVNGGLAVIDWHPPDCPLTSREIEVLRIAADGMEPTDIAACLSLSPGTVRNYLARSVSKLQARNRLDAIRVARSTGLL